MDLAVAATRLGQREEKLDQPRRRNQADAEDESGRRPLPEVDGPPAPLLAPALISAELRESRRHMVNGACVGDGNVVGICGIRYCSRDATFMLMEVVRWAWPSSPTSARCHDLLGIWDIR
ncbi:hypothetical protein QYE76_056606 [Lolium multiflorum]|uniref:Uncharacterized protein n=1 Tax=Lolium multiflorum TaxID=4521 RepID=A0AAD8T2F5_LOLMU|nr:hypothetical protein QYE76_056606 [Lolium multiflorum]